MVETSGRTPAHFGDTGWSGFLDPLRHVASKVADFFSPSAEAAASKNDYEINIELPGVPESGINVSVDHGMLLVTGEKHFERKEEGKTYFFSERSYGKFQRSFRLPEDADQDKVDATYKDGVLCLRIAKKQVTDNMKKIEVRKL